MAAEPVRTNLDSDPTGLEQESTEGVWRCSCRQNFRDMGGLGGHIGRQKDKTNHKSLGFGPPLEPVQTGSTPVQEGKPKVKNKGTSGDKTGRITNDFDQAAFIVVTPKEFKTSSSLIWRAQKIAENRWNWPRSTTV